MRSIVVLCLLLCTQGFSQHAAKRFELTDTSFSTGSIYVPAQDILFDFEGRNDVLPVSWPTLDTFAAFMCSHPGMIIEIGSHTDQRGSDAMNIALSQSRANSVKRYLESRGASSFNLAAVGFGETRPIHPENVILEITNKNEREALYQQNRRIDFKILYLYSPVFSLRDTSFINGATLSLPILFDLSKSTLRPESLPVLDSLAALLIVHPELSLDISVHTDTRVSTKYSSCLSCARAKTIRDTLVARGIPSPHITYRGYQGDSPLITPKYIERIPSKEGQEELHRLNRRVTFRLTVI